MIIALFGDSCTGKSTIADRLKSQHNATVYTGKDYLRLAKNEDEARKAFTRLLSENDNETGALIVFVITEKPQLALVPPHAVRVLVTAPLDIIEKRFAARSGGTLPPPVAAMLARKHNTFIGEPHDVHIDNASMDFVDHTETIIAAAKR